MDKYEAEFKRLNKRQLQAVESLAGPVLVVAGPGTGKTQLLSMRVANILRKTDARPENILCLTFTNKAAINMQERLSELAGPEGSGVVVKTFHSFAAEIMNIYPEYFWNGARLTVAPEAIQLDIIENILNTLEIEDPLAAKFADAFTATNDVITGLRLAKEAGLTPEKLKSLLKANIAYIDLIEPDLAEMLEPRLSKKQLQVLSDQVANLPDSHSSNLKEPLLPMKSVIQESLRAAINLDEQTGKTRETSKWKHRFIQTVDGKRGMFDERKRNEWWIALANVYHKYRVSMHERGYYDYSDMLVEVITQLEQEPELRADVQERFLYVLIDEFQDTNAAQLRLAHLIADHYAANGNPDLMAVGDDDQSIFKFNGAELNNMLHFRRSYPKAKLIVLEENYRSSQKVLETAKKVISQAEDRLVNRENDISKNLLAVSEMKDTKGIIEHWQFNTRDEQLFTIAAKIKKLYTSNQEIAVLARNHESLVDISARLLESGVPLDYEQRKNILENEAVVNIVLLARLLCSIRDGDQESVNALIHKLIRHPMWGVSSTELWQLALDNRRTPHWLDSIANTRNHSLSKATAWMMDLARETDKQPLAVMLEYILGLKEYAGFTSPIKNYFTRKNDVDNIYLETLSALRLLRNLADEFAHGNHATLDDFIRFIDVNAKNNKIIADESPFISADKPVKLLTVYKAKGLEFNTVFIIDAMQKKWEPRAAGKRKPPVNLPLQPFGENMDDYIRLFYVAITRARQDVVVTSYKLDDTNKEAMTSTVIQNAFATTKITPIPKQEIIEILQNSMSWPTLKSSSPHILLGSVLKEYNLSVTHLLNFLDISRGGPEYFFERNILKLPDVKSTSQAFGTAMHEAMRQAQVDTNLGSFGLNKTIKKFHSALQAEQLDITQHDKYIRKGENTLQRLFADLGLTLPKGSYAEPGLRNVILGNARMSGAFDRVDLHGKESILIVDYKTGKPLPSLSTTNKSLEIKAWKHRSQLVFYSLLAHNSPRFRNVKTVNGQMVYLEAKSEKELAHDYTPTEEDLRHMERLINAVWHKIMSLKFPNTSNYEQDMSGIKQFEQDLIDGKI